MNFNSRPSARGDFRGRCAVRADDIFQFTPLREGRRAVLRAFAADTQFQFTPLREGRQKVREREGRGDEYFNSRPSARGDTAIIWRWTCRSYFNSRPSARGDRKSISATTGRMPFQFTPLREGRHTSNADNVVAIIISIHAPPRGATHLDCRDFRRLNFNSRPSARGDFCPQATVIWQGDFNSRPSARGDNISPRSLPVKRYFNSRPSARGDS